MTNEHALKIFLRRVPKANIAQIKHVIVQIHGWMNPNRSLKYDTFNGTDASSLNAVSRALAKHFKSLQFLRFEVPCWMPSYVRSPMRLKAFIAFLTFLALGIYVLACPDRLLKCLFSFSVGMVIYE